MVGLFGKAGILGVLLLVSLSGCDFRRVVVNDPLLADSLEVLVPGKSTIQDIATALGAPDEIEEGASGMVFRYRYGDSKTMRVNFGWVLRVLLPVAPSMNLGRGEGATYILHVALRPDSTFDHSVIQPPPDTPHFWFWPF
ncbi:MAG: hypothetical protein NPIRA06_24370 [Nitrospirales bacterium]|nr:MAG: hypothetical protein NPIRA06_24370 [Nitrospirales bacterium]